VITHVAIKHDDIVYALPKPKRHCHVLAMMKALGIKPPCGRYQGFVTDTGTFVDRKEGARIALASGQIVELQFTDDELLSEDLW